MGNENLETEQAKDNIVKPDVMGEFCPNCKSYNVIEVDDHWNRCMDCNFSYVG